MIIYFDNLIDIYLVPRNYDPKLHPFEVPREYQRALNAVKLDKIFSKPFIGALDGHKDVVQCLMKHPSKLSLMVSGACDGQIKVWNLATRKCVHTWLAHKSIVRSLCIPNHGNYFFSVDDSHNIKQWNLNALEDDNEDNDEPMNTLITKSAIMSMDHHHQEPLLITCGERVELWEETRVEPLRSYNWGVDTVYSVKFNPIETHICAASASDRSITLYDTRKPDPLRRVVLEMRTNALCWNPMEAFVFTAANEDHE